MEPHLHSGPSGSIGDVAELAAETVRTPEELAADEDPSTDAHLAEDVDEALEIPCDSLPVLGESREVRLVVGAHRQTWQPSAELVGDGDLGPAEVRRAQQRSGPDLDEPGQRDGAACGDQPGGRDLVEGVLRERGKPVEHRARARTPVVAVHALLEADVARQILDANGEVVDVDLEADRDDAVPELEGLARPADPPGALVLARLPEQTERDQLTDEARHRPPCEARLRRHAGARTRLATRDLLEHDTEVRPPDRRLVGARRRVGCALEAHARRLGTGGVSVDSSKPRHGFCMTVVQINQRLRLCQHPGTPW